MKKQKEKKKRSKPLLEHIPETGGSSGLARALGSTDRDTREKGLIMLSQWLESHDDVTQNDIVRLWKALYFCFWHSDMVTVQTALADRLSSLICDLSPKVSRAYFEGFVETMRREWAGIDQHRMNKYLMLVRKFYGSTLDLFARSKWDVDIIEEYSNLWKDKVLLLPTPNDLGAGLAYHLCDVVVTELVKREDSARGVDHDALMAILSPFVECLSQTRNKILIKKIHAGVFTEVAQSVESRTCPFTSLDTKELAQLLFSVGSHKETRSKNREYLYLASSELEQALKASQKKKQKSTEPPPAKKPAAKTKKNKNVVPVTKNEAEPVTNGVPTSTPVVATDTHEDASKNNKKKKSKKQANIESDDTKVLESPPTERRKSVRFSLKKNLVRRIGEPPFPEDVRTPPTSKPKGSALKRTSGLAVDSRKKSLTFDSETKNGDGSKAHQKKNKKRKKHL